jgi:phage terminase small subunit
MSQLTAKQQRFVAEYLIDRNATQAAIRAGYAKGKAAEVQGSRLLGNAKVRAEVDKALSKINNKLGLTAEKILQDVEDVRQKATQDGVYAAALKASELQAKSLRADNPFADQPVKHQIVDENERPVSEADIARRIAFVFASATANPGVPAPAPTQH